MQDSIFRSSLIVSAIDSVIDSNYQRLSFHTPERRFRLIFFPIPAIFSPQSRSQQITDDYYR